MALLYAARTHPGKRHRSNQDAVLVRGRVYQKPWHASGSLHERSPLLVAVADGVSTSPAPAAASRATLSALRASFAEAPQRAARQHVDAAFERFCALKSTARRGMASTLVAAVVRDARALVFNAGDSRAYFLASGGLQRVSKDHTVIQRMLDRGEITPAQAARAANLYGAIDSCFVADPYMGSPEIHACEVSLAAGSTLMLCSDGVTSYLSDDEIARAGAAVRYDPRALVERLFTTAIDRGGEDDLSAVVLTRKRA